MKQFTVCFEILGDMINEDEQETIARTTWYVTEKTYNELLDILKQKQQENLKDINCD